MLSFLLSICDTEDQQLTFLDLFFLKFESSLSWVRLELFDEKKEPKISRHCLFIPGKTKIWIMDMNKNLIINILCPIQDVSNYHYRLKYYK